MGDEPGNGVSVSAPASAPEDRKRWRDAFAAFLEPRVIGMVFLGFSAGLPIFLIFGTLSVWLTEAGVQKSSVTFFSWAALAYSFKYVWAPLVDRLRIPWLGRRLGRRRSWLLVAQIAVAMSMLWMGISDPRGNLTMIGLAAVMLGFSSATQDIVIDAYRIEAVAKSLQAMMASAYVAGYRMGMLLGGAGALKLASVFARSDDYDARAWALAYACMALAMLVGMVTTLLIKEPAVDAPEATGLRTTSDYLRFLALFALVAATFTAGFVFTSTIAAEAKTWLEANAGLVPRLAGFVVEALRLVLSVSLAGLVGGIAVRLRAAPPAMLRETYVQPFTDFVQRYGRSAFLLLLLIGTYRISDIVLGAVANVFYIEQGFTKDQIAAISKTYGLFMTLAGGFLAGLMAVRYGVIRTLFVGALLSSLTNLLFAYLATAGNDVSLLIAVITADNLAGGLATTAFVAYLSSLTNLSFTATQYALFSSIMTLGPKLVAGYSGMLAASLGYPIFFVSTAFIGVPVLMLVVMVGRLEAST